jgi:hypothetical protein
MHEDKELESEHIIHYGCGTKLLVLDVTCELPVYLMSLELACILVKLVSPGKFRADITWESGKTKVSPISPNYTRLANILVYRTNRPHHLGLASP